MIKDWYGQRVGPDGVSLTEQEIAKYDERAFLFSTGQAGCKGSMKQNMQPNKFSVLAFERSKPKWSPMSFRFGAHSSTSAAEGGANTQVCEHQRA